MYRVIHLFSDQSEHWANLLKAENTFRKKIYKAKTHELLLVPFSKTKKDRSGKRSQMRKIHNQPREVMEINWRASWNPRGMKNPLKNQMRMFI